MWLLLVVSGLLANTFDVTGNRIKQDLEKQEQTQQAWMHTWKFWNAEILPILLGKLGKVGTLQQSRKKECNCRRTSGDRILYTTKAEGKHCHEHFEPPPQHQCCIRFLDPVEEDFYTPLALRLKTLQ